MKIFDTSSIICLLREANCSKTLNICKKHGYQLAVTKQVYEELMYNPESLKLFQSFDGFSVIDEHDPDCFSKFEKRYPWLHKGEISVLCTGISRKQNNRNYHCVIDEKARNLKDEYELKVNGTIGLLLWQKNQLKELTSSDCTELYDTIKKSSFWISEDILQELLQ